MGQLNLKDALLAEEAKRLAALFGTSTTEAVRRAVHDRLLAEESSREAVVQQRLARIEAAAREFGKLFPPGTTSDHSDFYDEHGLPK